MQPLKPSTKIIHLTLVCSVKTKLQVQVRRKENGSGIVQELQEHHYESTLHAVQKIIEDEGVSGLYNGIASSLIGVVSTNFAYFYWYSTVRTLYITSQASAKAPGTAAELSLGAVAGGLAQIFTIPLAVVTTRQQTQTKQDRRNMMVTAREIIDSEDGVSGLWRGLKASLVLVVNPSITYGAYQRLKDVLFPNKTHLRPWESFCESHQASFTRKLCWVANNNSSPGGCIKSAGHHCDAATDCSQGPPAVKAAARETRKEIQDVWRGSRIHHPT